MGNYIICAKRTAIGKFLGSLSQLPAHKLGSIVISNILKDNKTINIDEVITGQVLSAGAKQNPARQASISSGISYNIPATTINQVCGSGLKAIIIACQSIESGNSNAIIAGGQENMSLTHHSCYIRKGMKMANIQLEDLILTDGLTDAFSNVHMGITAENLVKKYNISRQEQDLFALASQTKAYQAQKLGLFTKEIVPITLKNETIFAEDENIRIPNQATLSKLKPAFIENGSVTAGNSSSLNDGAAYVLVANEKTIKKNNITPIARIVSYANTGIDPQYMGIGPVPAVKNALKIANWNINELEIVELNEAFASQAISVNKELGWNPEIVNIQGGAIALGHPIGASGSRIIVTLVHSMQQKGLKKGLATLCIGGGMGIAMCIELC